MQASLQERLAGAVGTAIVIALLGWALIAGLGVRVQPAREAVLTLLTLAPPPRPQPPKRQVIRPKSGKASGRASPRNLRNKATDVVAPPAAIPLPLPPPVIAAPKAGTGTAPSNGASDRPGPGEGAGGQGDGRGSGGSGDGEGDGGGDTPPRLIRGRLKFSDLPPALRDADAAGTVSVEYRVETDGRVGNCTIIGSSGNADLDSTTCDLIRRRFRFDPSRDAAGRPVRSIVSESHSWIVDRDSRPDD